MNLKETEELDSIRKRTEALHALKSISRDDGTPYFNIEFLIKNVLKLTPEEMKENENYWTNKNSNGSNGIEFEF